MKTKTKAAFDYEAYVTELEPGPVISSTVETERRSFPLFPWGLEVIYPVKGLEGVVLFTFGHDHGQDDWIRYFLFDNGEGLARDGQERDYGDTARFNWDPKQVLGKLAWERSTAEQLKEIETLLRDHIRERFREDINDQLGGAAMIPEDYRGEDFRFTCGSHEELETLCRMILYSFPEIWGPGGLEKDVVVMFLAEGRNSSGECQLGTIRPEDEYWDDDDDGWRNRIPFGEGNLNRLEELMSLAVSQNHMTGELLEYNDEAYNRMSGHYWEVDRHEVNVPAPSMHDRAEARISLRAFLSRNLAVADLDRLLPLE